MRSRSGHYSTVLITDWRLARTAHDRAIGGHEVPAGVSRGGEREFFIRKAIGWVLRETSKKRPAAHAAEIARNPSIHDQASLAAFYRSSGRESSGVNSSEDRG